MGYQATLTRRELIRRGTLAVGGAAAGLSMPGLRAPAAAATAGDDWANYAAQFVGAPYVYGGNTPSGWDCSGFTQYVAAHFGVPIDHGTATQYYEGVVVPDAAIRAGDYIYFQNTFDFGISHVGIALGDGTMVNALNQSAGTVINDYSTAYWVQHWYGAARFWGPDAGPPQPQPQPTPQPQPGPTGYATTTANLNLRAGPGTGYAVLAVMPQGTTVQLTGQTSGVWEQAVAPQGTGWASSAYLAPANGPQPTPTPQPTPQPVSGSTAWTTADLNLRSTPGGSVLAVMPQGTEVQLTGNASGVWRELNGPYGHGWSSVDYLTTTPPTRAPASTPTPAPTDQPTAEPSSTPVDTPVPTNPPAQAPSPTDTPQPTATPTSGQTSDDVYVAWTDTALQAQPNATSAVLQPLPKGSSMVWTGGEVWDGSHDWYQVVAAGTTGWTMADYIYKQGTALGVG